jgi:hypothetical protein
VYDVKSFYMELKMKKLIIVGLLGSLAGCAAQVLSSNPRSVTVRAGQVKIGEAQALGDSECAKHKRYARLVIRPTDHTPNHWVFDCVE